LFSPNIFTLIPNLRYITPAVDAIATTSVNINEHNRLSAEGIFEFTNLHSTIFSGSVSIQNKQRKNIHLSGSAGLTHQIRGLKYFWYPATRKWVEMSLNYFTNSFSVSIMSYSESSLSCNISYRRAL
jgi:hypothetical protein